MVVLILVIYKDTITGIFVYHLSLYTHAQTECEQCSEVLCECERVRGESEELREKLGQLVSMNQRLRDSNVLLQGKCETLLEDLSIKEAKWTEREEALKNEVSINTLIIHMHIIIALLTCCCHNYALYMSILLFSIHYSNVHIVYV